MTATIRLLPKEPPPKPETNLDMIHHLTVLLNAAMEGTLEDLVVVSTIPAHGTLIFCKDNDPKFAAYASIIAAEVASGR